MVTSRDSVCGRCWLQHCTGFCTRLLASGTNWPLLAVEIEEAVVSLARAVFAHNGRLVFGGHPSISPLVASVAAEYFPARHIPPGKEPVWIYQSEAFRKVIPPSTQTFEELGYARIQWIDKQGNEEFSAARGGTEQWLESLHRMREDMIDLKPGKDQPVISPPQHPVAMVAIGGMEGVIREARLFIEKTQCQVYVLRTTAKLPRRLPTYHPRTSASGQSR